MTTQQRKEIIEEIFEAGMPLQLALVQAFEIFTNDGDGAAKEEQMFWLLQCVFAQGKKEGVIETRHEAMERIRQIHA
jgi:hypothetical protein